MLAAYDKKQPEKVTEVEVKNRDFQTTVIAAAKYQEMVERSIADTNLKITVAGWAKYAKMTVSRKTVWAGYHYDSGLEETRIPENYGVKLHVVLSPGQVGKAWNIIIAILIKHEVSDAKVSILDGIPALRQKAGANNTTGKDITIHCFKSPNVDWENICQAIESGLVSGGVKKREEGRILASDQQIVGSSFLAYRDDSCTLKELASLSKDQFLRIIKIEENLSSLQQYRCDMEAISRAIEHNNTAAIIEEMRSRKLEQLYISEEAAIEVGRNTGNAAWNPFGHPSPLVGRISAIQVTPPAVAPGCWPSWLCCCGNRTPTPPPERRVIAQELSAAPTRVIMEDEPSTSSSPTVK